MGVEWRPLSGCKDTDERTRERRRRGGGQDGGRGRKGWREKGRGTKVDVKRQVDIDREDKDWERDGDRGGRARGEKGRGRKEMIGDREIETGRKTEREREE